MPRRRVKLHKLFVAQSFDDVNKPANLLAGKSAFCGKNNQKQFRREMALSRRLMLFR